MKVAIVGCGYVGAVTGIGLASLGHDVVGIDQDAERVAILERGETPFHEPGLEDALRAARTDGRFRATGALAHAAEADVVFLCVQTPPTSNGTVELGYLVSAAEALAGSLLTADASPPVVAIRSTVPPGTNSGVVAPLFAALGHVAVASNPEFLREGSALADFLEPDRVVVGVREASAADALRMLYAPLGAPFLVTSPETAELAKYAANALLATLVSFSNEIARVCESTPGVDVEDVLGIVHRDRRLTVAMPGRDVAAEIVSYLRAGCGYGGSCLAKDLAALTAYAESLGEEASLLRAVAAINDDQARRLVERADGAAGGLRGRRVAVLGAAFKAGTDDLRNAPSLRVVGALVDAGAAVVVFDPLVPPERVAAAFPPGTQVAPTLEDAVDGAAAVVLTTNAPEFGQLARLLAAQNGRTPLVVDGRRTLTPDHFPADSFLAVGRAERPR